MLLLALQLHVGALAEPPSLQRPLRSAAACAALAAPAAARAASVTYDFGYRMERALDPEKRGPATGEASTSDDEGAGGMSMLDAMCNPPPPEQPASAMASAVEPDAAMQQVPDLPIDVPIAGRIKI